ncbi:MAG: hypothetical protein K1Y36_07755 [Blastocatellia bacterium]|nr:hypothetical protein [Blastocatellia bacterium]
MKKKKSLKTTVAKVISYLLLPFQIGIVLVAAVVSSFRQRKPEIMHGAAQTA